MLSKPNNREIDMQQYHVERGRFSLGQAGQLGIVTSRAWCCQEKLRSDVMIPGVGKRKLNSASQTYSYFGGFL